MKFESKKLVTKLVLALFMMFFCSTVAFAEQAHDDLSGHAYCATIEEYPIVFYFKEDGRLFFVSNESIGEVLKVLSKKNVSENEISQLSASCKYGGIWIQNKAKRELTIISLDGSNDGVFYYIISSDGENLTLFDPSAHEQIVFNRYY